MDFERLHVKVESSIINKLDSFPIGPQYVNLQNTRTPRFKEMVTGIWSLYRYTKKELINYFTESEALLIINALSNLLYSPDTISPKVVLVSNISDSIKLDNLNQTYEVDENILIEKLKKLSEFQAYTVILMCYEYCSISNNTDNKDLLVNKIFLIDVS